jgi:hypothetical protein
LDTGKRRDPSKGAGLTEVEGGDRNDEFRYIFLFFELERWKDEAQAKHRIT